MATTKVINDLIDLNQSGSTNALKGCAGTTAQRPTESFDVEYLIVGGGGTASGSGSGGGGAGGLLTATTTVASGVANTLQIGAGATADSTLTNTQPNGGNTVFSSFTADGGGSGQRRGDGTDGGSGGGGGVFAATSAFVGGSATSGQGNDGGDSNASFRWATGGGGGSGSVGNSSSANQSGNGGSGTNMTSFISVSDATSASVGEIVSGTNVFFAGGGGGGGGDDSGGAIGTSGNVIGGTGGSGGGGTGSQTAGVRGTNGTINSGGGGGGGVVGSSDSAGGDGGSGVAIFKYDNTKVTGATVDGTLVAPSTTAPTVSTCNYPTTATALYQLEDNTNDTCGSNNATDTTDITYNSSGKFGKSAVFNGTSSYFKLPLSTLGDNPFTISMWLNFDDLASERFIFSKNPGSGGYGFYAQSPPGVSTITFIAYDTGGGGYSVTTTTSMSTGVWYNYVLTFDFSSSIKAYLNGSQEATATPSGTFWQNSDTVYIGRYHAGATYFDGEMDQIRVFPSALTPDQVTEVYNEVAYQTKFTNGTTDTIVFKEGSGNITFQKADTDPGAEIGMLRCNTTLGQMEHYTSSGYKTFTNL